MASRRTGWAWVLLALACSTSAPQVSPNAAPTTDAGPAGPYDLTIASSPPIDLPGTTLWLDADYGIAHQGTQVRAWTDRSGYGHVLEPEAAANPSPSPDRLAGHGALRLGGHARMVLDAAVDDQARAALTIGDQDFLIALVVRREGGAPDPVLFALEPTEAAGPAAILSLQPALRFELAGAGSTTVTTGAAVESGPHLVVVVSIGPRLVVRLDGQEVGARPLGRLAGERMDGTALSLPFLAPSVGGRDLERPGWSGLVGDVVIVAGQGVEGAVPAVEAYLRKKYAF